MNDLFEAVSKDLEKAMAEREQETTQEDLGDRIVKAIRNEIDLAKGKKKDEPNSDLSAEDKAGKGVTEHGKDPAQNPVKAGQGYKDSSKYVPKGKDEMEDEDEDEDEAPSFFKKKMKKGCGKMKKSQEQEETEVDATEYMETMGEAVDAMHARMNHIEKVLKYSVSCLPILPILARIS